MDKQTFLNLDVLTAVQKHCNTQIYLSDFTGRDTNLLSGRLALSWRWDASVSASIAMLLFKLMILLNLILARIVRYTAF